MAIPGNKSNIPTGKSRHFCYFCFHYSAPAMIEKLIHAFTLPLQSPVLVFATILLIILLSPILLRMLKVPGIIGLIISGVLIGPHGLNIIEKNAAVDLFSTIGLLYIMFIAGLELDLGEFRLNRNRSLLFGLFTFILPLGIGFPVMYYLLDYSFYASLLISSMFSTHTLVAYPIVSRMGVSKDQAVAITVGGTILTDTAVLLLLAFIMSAGKGDVGPGFWTGMLVSAILFSVAMFWLVPRITGWFFKKMESEKYSHYIYVLTVVFLAAFLAEVAGVEPIIGAFVSGLVLNRFIPHSSVLMNRIEFIGSSLFIPFFLISVGMLVDMRVIMQGPQALIIAGILTSVALLGKWLAALATRLSFGFGKIQQNLIFGLSSSHAAATIAVILVGFQSGLIDENILNGTIILILVTCVTASVVTERAAKKLLQQKELSDENPSAADSSTEKILLPIANLANMEKLLDFGIYIKEKHKSHPVTIFSVVPNDAEADANLRKARERLQGLARHLAAAESQAEVKATIDHNATAGIIRTAKETQASILLLGWPQAEGLINRLTGNKVDGVVYNFDKTVFICHFAQPLVNHKRIIIAVPPLAELEQGFLIWMKKLLQLSTELGTTLGLYANAETRKKIEETKELRIAGRKMFFVEFTSWDSIMLLSHDINKDDILVLVSARKGSVSYLAAHEHLPSKFEKQYGTFSRIIVFPQQHQVSYVNDRYKDIDAEPILRGVETLNRLGKGVGSFFRKAE